MKLGPVERLVHSAGECSATVFLPLPPQRREGKKGGRKKNPKTPVKERNKEISTAVVFVSLSLSLSLFIQHMYVRIWKRRCVARYVCVYITDLPLMDSNSDIFMKRLAGIQAAETKHHHHHHHHHQALLLGLGAAHRKDSPLPLSTRALPHTFIASA